MKEATKHMTVAAERCDRNSLLSQIGNTPLLRLKNIGVPGVDIFAKAEWFNPGGSVKDRPVLHMLLEAERVISTNQFKVGMTIRAVICLRLSDVENPV